MKTADGESEKEVGDWTIDEPFPSPHTGKRGEEKNCYFTNRDNTLFYVASPSHTSSLQALSVDNCFHSIFPQV